jgi:hypothetical protein
MSDLAIWAVCLGVVKILASLAGLSFPRLFAEKLLDFPRSVWPARILSTVDLIWAALLLNEMPMGAFDKWKTALLVLCPLAIVLVPLYLDELLAARALGGLYLLLGAPILDAARWHPSRAAAIMSLSAYLLICFGIALVLAPYLLRRFIAPLLRDEFSIRISAGLGVAVGLLFVILGIFVY